MDVEFPAVNESDLIRDLGNYMYLLQNRPVRKHSLGRMLRSTKYTSSKISRLDAFFRFLTSVGAFLDMFDTEYGSELDTAIDVEAGPAFHLWNQGCDITDMGSRIQSKMQQLLSLFQMYGQLFTMPEKDECIRKAKIAYKALDDDFVRSVDLSCMKVNMMRDAVHLSFPTCIPSIDLVATLSVEMINRDRRPLPTHRPQFFLQYWRRKR